MKKITVISLSIALMLSAVSCVEHSAKYKALEARVDSIQNGFDVKSGQLDSVFSVLNDVEEGLNSIRESENIISVSAAQNKEGLNIDESKREQFKNDIKSIQDAITKYQNKIAELRKQNKLNSIQFTKRLNAITEELNEKSALIENLYSQLEEKDKQIKIKTARISELDKTVSDLKEKTADLNNKVSLQESELYAAYYIVGSKKDLISAGVLTRGGLFKSARISYNAEKSIFVKIDYREVSSISTNAKIAKVLSIHPSASYTMDKYDGKAVLDILDPDSFWESTKYLVIQTKN
ncbi:MAG: hypothetical protein LKI53_00450 [Bacteroidales bacterium]|jgi:uncharacterized protein YoxC|nr:hypothetical protein [Bacteroidales bacterium]